MKNIVINEIKHVMFLWVYDLTFSPARRVSALHNSRVVVFLPYEFNCYSNF